MPRGTVSRTTVWTDFLGPDNDLTWGSGTVHVDGWGFASVNEGSFEWTIDEPGGIIAVTTDTGDNDNGAFFAGSFQPSNGGCEMECRFKFGSATLDAVYAGFAETLALGTPVMPAEFATASLTVNGSGGMYGLLHDPDASTNDFRAVAGDGGTTTGSLVSGASVAAGIRANETIAADEWYIVRVEIDSDGTARLYIGHDGGLDADLKLVAEYETSAITATDQLYAVLMVENRSSAASLLEVDYLWAQGNRDWTVT